MVIDTHNLHSHAPPLDPNSLATPMDRTRSAHEILPVVLDQKPAIPQKPVRGRRGSGDAAMPRVLKHEPLYLESSFSTSSAAEAERSRMIAAASEVRKQVILKGYAILPRFVISVSTLNDLMLFLHHTHIMINDKS